MTAAVGPKLNLTLDCVVVDGQTAYGSGTDRAGTRHYLVVEDHGEPGKNRDRFGTAEDSLERTLLRTLGMNCGASDIATSAIHGGNFQVQAAE